ncbi:MAG: type I-B CRISPR-associated protein Cas8b1/Cst1 [Hydrotalea sp. AMD]|nr:MAG: type I-B CRISPR-associated protein Cas8b1/Cst1 [Hydrotalea sp. AMD]
MRESKNIENDWLTKTTGDPFADTGGFVIKYLWSLPYLEDKDIIGLIDYVANIYVNKWGGKLHAFFLNSTITQPAFKGQRKIDETLKYYRSLIDESIYHQKGYCRISGRKTKLFSAGRDNHILSGSGTFVNFHHNFESGLFLSKEMMIRMFFVPLGVILIGKNIGLIQSNRIDVQEYFVKKALLGVDGILSKITNSLPSKGVLRCSYSNPAIAIFSFADECISNMKIATFDQETEEAESEGVILNLYYFSNYGTDPNIQLFTMPASLFKFYTKCTNNPNYQPDWRLFIKHNYIKYQGYKPNYNQDKESYIEKANEIIEMKNNVYELLSQNNDLNFNIAKVGEDKGFAHFNKGDYDNWKQKSKNYSNWQKESSVKSLLNETPIKTKKGDFILNYQIEDCSKKWVNIIYEKLLKQESILPNIANYLRKWHKTNSFNFKIVKLYTLNILKMKSSTLTLIEKVADEVLKDESNLKKNLNQNISTSRYETLRSFIIKLIRQNHKAGAENPIITLEEYVQDLFYEGGNWREIRDLLLICLFQKMHERKIFFDIEEDDELEEDINEFETETIN